MRYEQIKPQLDEEVLDEVKMSPSALQKFARSPEAEGMLMGIEFEMCVPDVGEIDPEPDWEYDYDQDERAYDIDGIIDFFRSGEFSNMSSREASSARSDMYEQYEEWLSDKVRDSEELQNLIREKLEDYIVPEDFEDQAREELGDEADDDDVIEKSKELAQASIDEHMTDQSGDYWDDAFDDAFEDAMTDFRNDGDFDEQAWLSDIGVDTMSDAEREWSFDWPHMYDTNYGQGTGDIESVGDEFADAMGVTRVNTSTDYHGAHRDGKNWIIEPDGSIDADRGDAGLEFVSPPMPIADGLEMIKRFYSWAKDRGCYTNQSTGLHMNISVPDLTIDTLDYVKLALFLGDEYVLKQFGREYNSYAKSAMSKIKERIRPEDVPTVLNQVKQNLNSLASKTIHKGITDKYTSINTKSNYVEFRGPGGDYLDKDPLDLINTALRAAMALRIASDPEAYKQEYAKKLYKLVEQSPEDDDTVKLFSQYALGEIDKGELAARLEFARRGRKIEKAKKDTIKRMLDDPAIVDKINQLPSQWSNFLKGIISTDTDIIQSTANNVANGVYDDELTPDQRNLVVGIITNELAIRKQNDEKKAYWVTVRNGEGGKQLVYARNENEAILIGGKNIGLNRQQSISKLKAVEKTDRTPEQLYDGLPKDWKEFVDKIEDASSGVLRGGLDSMTTGRWQHRNLDDDEVDYIKGRIDAEIRSRRAQGDSTYDRKYYPAGVKDLIEALPAIWRDWVMHIPNKSEEILRDAVIIGRSGRWVDTGDMTQQSANLIVNLVNDELAYRAATGTEQEDGSVELQFAGGTPRGVDLDVELPLIWKDWVNDIRNKTAENLVSKKQGLENNDYNVTRAQKEKILGIINSEIARRSGTDNSSADRDDLLASLPDNVRDWLSNINDHSDMGLINILNNPTVTQDMTEQQAAYFRLRIKRELRRRGIEPSEAQPSSSQSGREVFDSLPEAWQIWATEIPNKDTPDLSQVLGRMHEGVWNDALSVQQRNFVIYSIEQELQRRESGAGSQNAATQQQTQLIQRDDPVSSNDPEAQSPIAQDGPGMWMVGNHTYGRETFRAADRESAIQAYAERNDITDIDAFKAERSFVAQLMSPDQGELDLREMRRLAGLR